MKKKRINLIINREDYQKYEQYFFYLKIFVFVLSIMFFISFLSIFINLNNKTKLANQLKSQKISLLQYLNNKTENFAKINYIEKKYQDLNLFLKEDANSSTYYNILDLALKESSQAAVLKNFKINKNREVEFKISFNDFQSLKNFFQFIETPKFLSNFETISLKNLSIIGQKEENEDNKKNYELNFVGKFINLEKLNNQ